MNTSLKKQQIRHEKEILEYQLQIKALTKINDELNISLT